MLTKYDLDAIGNLIDKKIATDVAAIQSRLANLERRQITSLDLAEVRILVRTVEKRSAAIEGRLTKFATKVESNFKKLHKELKSITNFFDNEYLKLDKRVDKLDQHIDHPPIATS